MFSKLTKIIQKAVALDPEEEEEEEELNEEDQEELSEKEVEKPRVQEYNTENLFNSLEQDDQDDKHELWPYYTSINDLASLFPGQKLKENPEKIKDQIENIKTQLDNLTQHHEDLKQMSTLCSTLASLEKQLNEKRPVLHSETEHTMKLKRQIKEFDSNIDSHSVQQNDIESEVNKLKEMKQQLEKHKTDQMKLVSQIEALQDQLNEDLLNEDEIHQQLENEREQYALLLKQLNAFQNEMKPNQINTDDIEISSIQLSIDQAKAENQRLKTQIPTSEAVSEQKSQLSDLINKLQEITQQKNKEPEKKEISNEFQKSVTTHLISYYQGEKKEINELAQIFGWTEQEVSQLNDENRGITGILKKGVNYFNRFQNIWTSWLITASES